ncbi:putative SWR1-complex protein 4 [Halenospora varia]|nr:putative SWR1-complex protein 4 [Halenospora varia]
MTSHDVRDMLDLPDAASRPVKKQKLAAPRPVLKGLAREVQNLSGDNPIAIVPEVSVFKKRRFANRKPVTKWELKPFKNSARTDESLILRHWRQKTKRDAQSANEPAGEDINMEDADVKPEPEVEVEESTFAKYNVRVQVPQYTEEEYISRLQHEEWTKDETDYLINLAQEYDLRWPVIWDRYEYKPPSAETNGEAATKAMTIVRTMEDMKERYYRVAAVIMAIRKPPIKMNSAEFNLHEVMANFNPAQEKARKDFAEKAFHRTKEEAREEESLLLELKRIIARSGRLNDERRELYALLETPPSTGNVGAFSTSQGLQQLLQQLMTADKSKKRKSIMGPDGMSPATGPSNQNQPANFDQRRESSARESISGPSGPSNNKKGPQGTDRRLLTEEEERIYGVTHHDRISTTGPAFRHEKISKPLITKSAVMQAKITNVLSELEIPTRVIMPTAEVAEAFDSLLQSINVLLESRKVADKLASELATAKALKAEREKKASAVQGEPTNEGENGAAADPEVKTEEREKSAAPSVHKRSASVLSTVSDKSTKRQKK